jgi:hypothetical protein
MQGANAMSHKHRCHVGFVLARWEGKGYFGSVMKFRFLLMLLVTGFALACTVGVASPAMACDGPSVMAQASTGGCTAHHKMPGDTQGCAPFCIALAPPTQSLQAPPMVEMTSTPRLTSPLNGRLGGPEPPPPRLAHT